MCSDAEKEIKSIDRVNDEQILIGYKHLSAYQKPIANGCVVMGIFTTAFGRLKLLNAMYALEDTKRVLYADTDSIIYFTDTKTKNIIHPILDNNLGNLSNELEKYNNASIKNFYCTGAKCYICTLEKDGKPVPPIVSCWIV